jgi:hypothetical protein
LGFAVGQLQRESRIAEKCGFIRAQIICQKLGYTRINLSTGHEELCKAIKHKGKNLTLLLVNEPS